MVETEKVVTQPKEEFAAPVKERASIPLFMTAAVTKQFDAEHPARCVELVKSYKGPEDEELKADEVLVRMHWSSINQIDFKLNTGKIPMEWLTVTPPFIGGRDGCGEIVALGSESSKHFAMHDTVLGICENYKFGTFGQYSIFKWKDICLKPSSVSMEHAAGLPMVLMTAWQCFSRIREPRSGLKRVLIHGGSGGVGSWLILLAKYYFHIPHVITTCRGVNCDYVKQLGADEVIDYLSDVKFDDCLVDKYSKETSIVDCVFDTVGGDDIMERSYRLLNRNGYFITTVPIQHFDTEHSVPKELIGYTWTFMKNKLASVFANKPSFYSVLYKSDGEQLKMLVDWIVQMKLDSKIQNIKYPLREIQDALEMSHSGHVDGKIIIDMSDL